LDEQRPWQLAFLPLDILQSPLNTLDRQVGIVRPFLTRQVCICPAAVSKHTGHVHLGTLQALFIFRLFSNTCGNERSEPNDWRNHLGGESRKLVTALIRTIHDDGEILLWLLHREFSMPIVGLPFTSVHRAMLVILTLGLCSCILVSRARHRLLNRNAFSAHQKSKLRNNKHNLLMSVWKLGPVIPICECGYGQRGCSCAKQSETICRNTARWCQRYSSSLLSCSGCRPNGAK